jgi:hypothetical protein
VTDGIESAVSQAKAAAAGKSVAVHGADTIQQLLNAGLLDEIHVDLEPLSGRSIRTGSECWASRRADTWWRRSARISSAVSIPHRSVQPPLVLSGI